MSHLELTEEQASIVRAELTHHVVTAVAGSGKTTTLAFRIAYLLDQNIDHRRILVLMFNKAAQQDFSRKLQQLLPPDKAKPEVRTFHAMGYRLYQRFIQSGHLQPFKTAILGEREIQFQILRIANQILDKNQAKEFKRQKKEHIDLATQFIETVKSQLHPPELVFEQLGLEPKLRYLIDLFSEFEQWRKGQSRISYADMLYDPVKAMRQNPALIELVQNKMDAILVDEYQDTNDIQHELLRIIAGERAKIMVVGDPDQTIYEFRGAKPEYMMRGFEKEFSDTRHLSLSFSFRYGHQVALLANHLISRNRGRRELLCKAHAQNPQTKVHLHRSNNEQRDIIDLLKTQTSEDAANTAILVRVWSQTVSLELGCLEHGIPYQIEGSFGVFQSDELRAIKVVLELACNHFAILSEEQRLTRFMLLLRFPHVGLNEFECSRLAEHLSRFSIAYGAELQSAIPEGLKKIQHIKLEKLAKALKRLETPQPRAQSILQSYINQTELYDGIRSLSLNHDQAEEKVSSIEGIVRFISGLEGKPAELLEHLNELQRRAESQYRQGVKISTIHRAKGLEWPTVLIPGLNDRNYPHAMHREGLNKSSIESERRLLYVALTRAREHLHLFAPGLKPDADLSQSRFEHELCVDQSLQLGRLLDEQNDSWHIPANTKPSNIVKRYAEEVSCELQLSTAQLSPEPQRFQEIPDQAIWEAERVYHTVLGEGRVVGKQHNSFTVVFGSDQERIFSKDTAARFFSIFE